MPISRSRLERHQWKRATVWTRFLPANPRGFPLIVWPSATLSTVRSTANSTAVKEWLAEEN